MYGPIDYEEKDNFWGELTAVGGWWNLSWCLCGDFNATKTPSDRTGGRISSREAKAFQGLIDDICLREFELQNASFTHKSTRGGGSKLDRFLANSKYFENFWEHREIAGTLGRSDHRIM